MSLNICNDNYPFEEIDITKVISHLIADITSRVQIFEHIKPDRLLVCTATNRRKCRSGTYGKLVPLRFENGSEALNYKGKCYSMPRIINNGKQILYIVYLYIPRFFNLKPIEKLRVIFHELFHISPEFNGDIRRFGKIKISHGHSRKKFDSLFQNELNDFYNYIKMTRYIDFLEMDIDSLQKNFKKVLHRRMKVPKPLPIDSSVTV